MSIFHADTQALIFDYGNTLIAFGREQVDQFDTALRSALETHFGPMDPDVYNARRNADRMAPYTGDGPLYKESEVYEMTAGMIREVYGREADQAVLDQLIALRQETFVRVVTAEAALFPILDQLRERYRLAILSNYPDGESIRKSLEHTGLAPYFETVAVSGDLGWCKPHPTTFQTVLDTLGLRADQAIFVGDNWLADVQGARRIGMPVVHFTRWIPPEHFDRLPGDMPPDAVIKHMDELLALSAASR